MKRFKIYLILPVVFLLLAVFVLPNITFAATDFGGEMLESLAINAGYNTEHKITAIIGSILKVIISLFGIFALIILVYAGVLWMFSKGDPVKIQKAKKLIASGLVGMLIIISSYAIVSFIIGKITGIFGGSVYGEVNTGDSSGNIGGFGTGFNVVSTYPRNEMQNIKTCARVSALFNRDVLDTTVNESSFTIKDEDNNIFFNSIKDKYFVNNRSVSFYHNNNDFDKFKVYRVTISNGPNGVKSMNGELLERAKTIWFKTSELDDYMPQVKRSYPENKDTGVCRKAVIQVEFQEGSDPANIAEMDPTSFNASNIKIQECTGSDFDSAICKDSSELIISSITPKTDFTGVSISLKNSMKEDTIYKVILKSSNNNPTLNPNDGIANNCGKPLDGNKNSKIDGTPDDDYFIIFKTGKTEDCEPVISNVVPISGYYNDLFKITGDYFGIFGDVSIAGMLADDNCTNADPIVPTSVNDEETCYSSWNNREINVRVPFASVSGQLKVELTDSVKATYKDEFDVLSPYLSKLQPDKGPAGEFIRISGKNFGNDVGKVYFISANTQTLGTVTEVFAPAACKNVDTWKNNEIIIETPNLDKGYYAVVIESENHFSNYLVYQIIDGVPGPGLCGIIPDQESKGASVVLDGIRFGDDSDTRDPDASVDFTGVKMLKNKTNGVISWKDTAIRLTVPEDAVDGYVSVTANNKESNPVYFNVLKSDLNSDFPRVIDSIGCEGVYRSPSPYSNSEGACTNEIINARFNIPMNISSFSGNINVFRCAGNDLECDTNISGLVSNIGNNIIAFRPNTNLIPNTWYKVIIKTGVKSAGSNKNLQTPFSWTFKTRPEGECKIDTLNVQPDEETVDLGLTASLFANPSSSIDKCAVLYSPDAYYKWNSEDLTKVFIYSSNVNKITSVGSVVALGKMQTPGTKVFANYKDTLINDYSNVIVRDTGFPLIVDYPGCEEDHRSPSPYNNTLNSCTNEIVKARFNISMDTGSFPGNIEVVKCSGDGIGCNSSVSGIVSSINNKIIAFRSSKNFDSDTWYQVTIKTGVKSSGTGKNLQAPFSWTFKTRPEGECEIDLLNVEPSTRVISINTTGDLNAGASSSFDPCATLYSPDAYYNWSSTNLSKVTIKSTYVNKDLGTGEAVVFGKSETPGTFVEAQYKNTDIKDSSNVIVFDSGFPEIIDSDNCEGVLRSPSPYRGSIEACTNMLPEVVFNVDMNISSFVGNFEIKQCIDENIGCDVVVDGVAINLGYRRMLFKPSKNLNANTWYQATIKTGVKSISGKNLRDSYVWSFRTRTQGECKVNLINVDPESATMQVNSNLSLYSTTSSTDDVCAFIYDESAQYTWTSNDINTVTIKSTSIEPVTKAGNAIVFGRSSTPINIPTQVEARYKKTNIRDHSDVTVSNNGIGAPCDHSLMCASGLCCSAENKCTNIYSTCIPRVPEISSCSAEDPINYSDYVLTNPSPFKNKTEVCKNALINLMFDIDMLVDGSVNSINNINNIKISECSGNFDSNTCGQPYSPTKIKTIGSRTIEFIPNDGFESKLYKVTVGNNVRMNFYNVNNSLGNEYSWMFSVGENCKIDRIDGNPGFLETQFPYKQNNQLNSVLGSSQGKCLSLIAPKGSIFNWHTADNTKVSLCLDNTFSSCNNSDIATEIANIQAKSSTYIESNLVDVSIILPNNEGVFYSRDNNPKTSLVKVSTCDDGYQNWNETSIDNGGVCSDGISVCGNGVKENNEDCDNGINNGNDGICHTNCKLVGGIGDVCVYSTDCLSGLCCGGDNKCTDLFNTCPPRVNENASCSAENSFLTNVLTNPSPFKNKDNACPNSNIVVSLDLEMITEDFNPASLNNIDNIKFENCGLTGTPCSVVDLSDFTIQISNKKNIKIETKGLLKNNYYRVTLNKNMKSKWGVNMLTDYVWGFKTRENDCSIDYVSVNPIKYNLHNRYNPNYDLNTVAGSNDGKCMDIIPPVGSTYFWMTQDVSKVGLCSNNTYQDCNISSIGTGITSMISIKGKDFVKDNLVDSSLTLPDGRSFFSKNNTPPSSFISVGNCSDGVRNGNETGIDIGGACNVYCGNNLCEIVYGENIVNCPQDCAGNCNNNNKKEDYVNNVLFNEQCDGTDLDGLSCSNFRDINNNYFQSGNLKCSSSCNYFTSGCYTCGNGIKEDVEQCDDGINNGAVNSNCTNNCKIKGIGECNDDYTGCGDGLCCNLDKKCTNVFSTCPPSIPKQSSCEAEDPSNLNLRGVQITNPSPFENKNSVCANSRIVVAFNIKMKNDESTYAINNLNNFEVIKCNNDSCDNGVSVKHLGDITTSDKEIVWTIDESKNGSKFLDFNTTYKITISKGVQTYWNYPLDNEYSWIFKTGNKDCSIDSVQATPSAKTLFTLNNVFRYSVLRSNALSNEGKCLSIIPPIGTIYNWKTENVSMVSVCDNNSDLNCSLSSKMVESVKIKGVSSSEGEDVLVDVTITLPDSRNLTSAPNTSKIMVVDSICGDGYIESNEECDNGSNNGKNEDICSDGLDGYPACTIKPKIDGFCGNAIMPSVFMPIDNLCNKGIPSKVQSSDSNGSGPWSWDCIGSAGGSTMKCLSSVDTCGNGELDLMEMCDVGNQGRNIPGKIDSISNICGKIFGEDNYIQISGNPICLPGCVVDVSKACVSTYKFDKACTSDASKVVTLNNSFNSGDLSLFSKINGLGDWKINNGVLNYSQDNNQSTLIYGVKVDADNYTVKGSFKAKNRNNNILSLILNKSKDGNSYYKIEIKNNSVILYNGLARLDYNNSYNFIDDKWYDFTIIYRTSTSNPNGAQIIFDVSKDGKKSSDAASKGFVNLFRSDIGSKIGRGYFGISTDSSENYFDNLYVEYNDDLYEYNNMAYNFGFYYCKAGRSILSTRNDKINTNDAYCQSGLKCIDRSCSSSCEEKGGFSGVYVINNSESAKAFVDSNGKPVMVMRVWNVPRMYENGQKGPFINFSEWLTRMKIGGVYDFVKRSSFPYDYMIYNQGNSYYFWAPNINSEGKGFINVYVLTYQEGGDRALFDEIINNVRFTTNLE